MKQYIKPEMEIIEMESKSELLAGSGEDNWGHGHGHGRENACEHGAPK